MRGVDGGAECTGFTVLCPRYRMKCNVNRFGNHFSYLPACSCRAAPTTSSVFSFSSCKSGVFPGRGTPFNCQSMVGSGLPSASHSSTKALPSLIVWLCGAVKISGSSARVASGATGRMSDFRAILLLQMAATSE